MTKDEHKAIIARCEQVRKALYMNKSKFAAGFGMKPQTWANFTGAQGSKPNIELVRGVILTYCADPIWLLTGEGAMFRKGAEPTPFITGSTAGREYAIPSLGSGALTDAVKKLQRAQDLIARDLDAVRHTLKHLSPGVEFPSDAEPERPHA